jgi:hypothetical protein
MALAHAEVIALECSGCHRPLAETTDPENARAYTVDDPVACFACQARARATKSWHEQAAETGTVTDGVMWQIEFNDPSLAEEV